MEGYGRSNGRLCGRQWKCVSVRRRRADYHIPICCAPEAFNKRKAQAAAASSAGRSMITQSAAVPEAPASSNRSGGKTLGFIAAVCLSLLTLIIRRPSEATLPGVPAEIPTGTKPPAAVVAGVSTFADPLILRLASIKQLTHDAKTLRF